jgi:hypothetical protein
MKSSTYFIFSGICLLISIVEALLALKEGFMITIISFATLLSLGLSQRKKERNEMSKK